MIQPLSEFQGDIYGIDEFGSLFRYTEFKSWSPLTETEKKNLESAMKPNNENTQVSS